MSDGLPPPNEWQRIDPSTGLVMPWYTHGALDEIATWDLAGKVALEWGGGASSIWWATKCARVYSVDSNPDWISRITSAATSRGITNLDLMYRSPVDADAYLAIPDGCTPDIVCIDGSLRTECLRVALTLPRPISIIFDNWQQDGVFIDPDAEELMVEHRAVEQLFVQADHKAHDGRPWQTAIWKLP